MGFGKTREKHSFEHTGCLEPGGRRKQRRGADRRLWRRRLLSVESLEDRLVLTADPFWSAESASAAVDWTVLIEDVEGVGTVKLVDTQSDDTVASEPLSAVDAPIRIVGSSHDDVLRTALGAAEIASMLPLGIVFEGGPGTDTLVGPDSNSTWNVTGGSAGHLGGAGVLDFVDTETLEGAADNEDTFIIEPGGSVSELHGGAGGSDSIILDGGTYTSIVFTFTDADAGSIDLEGSLVEFTGMEPISDRTSGDDRTIVLDNGDLNDRIEISDNSGSLVVQSGNVSPTFETVIIASAPSGTVTIQAGGGDDTFVLQSLPTGFSGKLTLDGQEGTDTVEAEQDTDFTLRDSQLTIGSDVIGLAAIEQAELTGGPGENTFDVTPSGDLEMTIDAHADSVTDTLLIDAEGNEISTTTGSITVGTHQPINFLNFDTAADPADEVLVLNADFDVTPGTVKNTFQGLADWAQQLAGFGALGRPLPLVGTVEVQTVTISGSPDGGTYTLNWQGRATAPISHNATSSDVQDALRTVRGLEEVVVSGSGTSPNLTHTITFRGVADDAAALTSTSELTGGTPAIAHATVQDGGKTFGELLDPAAVLQTLQAELENHLDTLPAPMASDITTFLDPAGNGNAASFTVGDMVLGDLTISIVEGEVGSTIRVEHDGTQDPSINVQFTTDRTTEVWLSEAPDLAAEDLHFQAASSSAFDVSTSGTYDFRFGPASEAFVEFETLTFSAADSNSSGAAAFPASGSTDLHIGVLGTAVSGGGIDLSATVPVAFLDPASDGDRVSLSELSGPIDTLVSLSPAGSTDADFPFTVKSGFDSAGTPSGGTVVVGDGADFFTFPSGAPIVVPAHVRPFTLIGAADLLQPLLRFAEWLDRLEGSDLYDGSLPFIHDVTFGDALDFGAALRTKLTDNLHTAGTPQFMTVQELAGVAPSSQSITPFYDATEKALTFRVQVAEDQSSFLAPIDLDLDAVELDVEAASNAAPIVITSTGHGLTTGQQVTISGVRGNFKANGTFAISVIDSDTFSLDGSDGTRDNLTENPNGNRAYEGGGTIELDPLGPLTQVNPHFVGDVEDVVVDPHSSGNDHLLQIDSTGHGLVAGDAVTISRVQGIPAANGTFRVTSAATDSFEVTTQEAGAGTYVSGTGRIDLAPPANLVLPVTNVTVDPIPIVGGTNLHITSPHHGLATGDTVTISGVQGIPEANGTFTNIFVPDADEFRVLSSSDVTGTYVPNTGQVTVASGLASSQQNIASNVTVLPEVVLDFTYGVDLVPQGATVLSAPAETRIPQSGQLSSDATFWVELDDGTTATRTDVIVLQSDTSDNTGLSDLVLDVEQALQTAGLDGNLQVTLLSSPETGNRLQFAAKVAGETFTVGVDSPADPAVTELGLRAAQTVLRARHATLAASEFTSDTSFTLDVGGTQQSVTLPKRDEVQTFKISGTPSGGTYTLSWTDSGGNTHTTAAINHDDDAATVQTRLRNLTGLSQVGVALQSRNTSSVGNVTDVSFSGNTLTFTSSDHGLHDGEIVVISGVGGISEANGTFTVSNVTTDTFDAMAVSTPSGTYTSGGRIELVRAITFDVTFTGVPGDPSQLTSSATNLQSDSSSRPAILHGTTTTARPLSQNQLLDDLNAALASTFTTPVIASFKTETGTVSGKVTNVEILSGDQRLRISSFRHGLRTGDSVSITGVGGISEANGTFTVASTAADTFEIELGSTTASGTYTSGTGEFESQTPRPLNRLVLTSDVELEIVTIDVADAGTGKSRLGFLAGQDSNPPFDSSFQAPGVLNTPAAGTLGAMDFELEVNSANKLTPPAVASQGPVAVPVTVNSVTFSGAAALASAIDAAVETALTGAGFASNLVEVAADGNLIQFTLDASASDQFLRILISNPADPIAADLGFANGQSARAALRDSGTTTSPFFFLDRAGNTTAGPSRITGNVRLQWDDPRTSAVFGFLELDAANAAARGAMSITTTFTPPDGNADGIISLDELNASKAVRIVGTVPLPSDGRLTGDATFDLQLRGDAAGTTVTVPQTESITAARPLEIFRLSSDAEFTLTVDGTDYDVTVAAADTEDNSDIADLVQDISGALGDAGVANDVTLSQVDGRLRFSSADPTDELVISFTGENSNSQFNSAQNLGFEDGQTHSLDELLIDVAEALAAAGLAGRVTAGTTVVAGDARLTLGVAFDDAMTLSSPNSVAENEVGLAAGQEIVTVIDTPVVGASLNDGNPDNSVDPNTAPAHSFDSASIHTIVGATSDSIQFVMHLPGTIAGTSESLPVVVKMADVTDPRSVSVELSGVGTGLEDLARNLAYDHVITALNEASTFLARLTAGGQRIDADSLTSEALAAPLPLVGRSIGELNDYSAAFARVVQDVAANVNPTLQDLELAIRQRLGLSPTHAGFAFQTSGGVLNMDLTFLNDVTTSVPFALNFVRLPDSYFEDTGDGSTVAFTVPGLAEQAFGAGNVPAGIDVDGGTLISLDGTERIGVATTAAANLKLDIDFSTTPTSPDVLLDNTSDLTLTAMADRDLDFAAQYDFATFLIQNGSLSIDAQWQVALDSAITAPISVGDLTVDDIDAALSGMGAANLPIVTDDDASSSVGTIDIGVPATGFTFEEAALGDDFAVDMTLTPANLDLLSLSKTDLSGSPIEAMASNADVLVSGIDEFLGTIEDAMADALAVVDLPMVGDQLAEAISPFYDQLRQFRAEARSRFQAVAQAADPVEGIRQALFQILGPSGLDLLRTADIFTPRDGTVDDIHVVRSDEIVDSNGDVIFGNGASFVEWNFRLGDKFVFDTPNFDLGLHVGDTPLEDLLPNFGFQLTANEGIRFTIEWNLYLGFGISEIEGFYLNAGANTALAGTAEVLPPGAEPVEEFRAYIGVQAGAADVDETGLSAQIALGMLQGALVDGTPRETVVTGTEAVEVPLLTGHDYSENFMLTVTYDQDLKSTGDSCDSVAETCTKTFSINYVSPGSSETFAEFIVNLNEEVHAVTQPFFSSTPLPAISIRPDFSRINGFLDFDQPTGPRLAFAARFPEIGSMEIHGAQSWGIEDGQVENGRSRGLGFDFNQYAANGVLTAKNSAPTGGRIMNDVDFILRLGGSRGPQPVLDQFGNDTGKTEDRTTGGTPLRIRLPETLHRGIENLDDLRGRVQDVIDFQLEEAFTNPDDRPTVTVTLDGNKFKFTSGGSTNDATAPALTITYLNVDRSSVKLVVGLDLKDPTFRDKPASLINMNIQQGLDTGNQAQFNRLSRSALFGATKKTDVVQPFLKSNAELRLHVDTNADHITGFTEQLFQLGSGTLELPSVAFDFKIDASAELKQVDAGGGQQGQQGSQQKKLQFKPQIDTFQFDNIALDIGSLLETIVKPIANGVGTVLDPIFSVLGDGMDSARGFLNEPVPVLDELGIDVTIMELARAVPQTAQLVQFFEQADQLLTFVTGINTFLRDFDGDPIRFGCIELVMDRDSPLFFPNTKVPVPCEVADSVDEASNVGKNNFLNVTNVLNTKPGGFQLDLLSLDSVVDMLLGEPFDIVSFNLPRVELFLGADFGFNFEDLGFNIHVGADVKSNLGIVYDSLGLERMIDAIKAGAAPDFSDLLDGFYIRNNVGPELRVALVASGGGSVDITEAGFTVFAASAEVDVEGFVQFDLRDPNEDGRLRLDEILHVTNEFANPENLFCMFDISGGLSASFEASVTIAEVTVSTDDLPFPTSIDLDFSLQELLNTTFGICGPPDPILATPVVIDGRDVLRVNTGPFAGDRIYGDTDDSDNAVYIRGRTSGNNVLLSGYGVTDQQYSGPFDQILVIGADFDDRLDFSGITSTPVEMYGLRGNDTLLGGGDHDAIYGGLGDDRSEGRGGSDRLFGGIGNDSLFGNTGNDRLDGGPDSDTLDGGSGNDTYAFDRHWGMDTVVEAQSTVLAGNITDVRQASGGNEIEIGAPAHGLDTGDAVTVYGVQGVPDANGEFTITRIDANSFSLDGTTFSGTYQADSGRFTDDFANSFDTYDFTRVRDDLTITLDMDGSQPRTTVTDLSNTVGHAGHQVEVIQAGRGNDFFQIEANAAQGVTLDGSRGSDDYKIVLGDDLVGSIDLLDVGETYDRDRLLVEGRDSDTQPDVVGVTDTAITFRLPDGTFREITYVDTGVRDASGDVSTVDDNGFGGIRVTATERHGLFPNSRVSVTGVDGVPDANGNFVVMVIDADEFDLLDATFEGTFVSSNSDTFATDSGCTTDSDCDLELIRIDLLRGDDTANVESTPRPTSVEINGGLGDDTISVGATAKDRDVSNQTILAGSQVTLNQIDGSTESGPLRVRGNQGTDVLNVYDTQDTQDNTGEMTSDTITGLGMAVGIEYKTFEELLVQLGMADDDFTVQSTHLGTTTILGGDNDDTGDEINVRTIAGPTTVEGEGGDDVINVGSLAPSSGGVVDQISALLTVYGGDMTDGSVVADLDVLNVDDAGDSDDNLGTLTATTVRGLDMPEGVDYFGVEELNIDLGTGHDRFNVQATAAISETNLDAHAGDDLLYVSSGADLGGLDDFLAPSSDTDGDLEAIHTEILHGTLDAISGELNIDAGTGHNTLSVSDREDEDADTGAIITAARIENLAPAVITYAATMGDFSGQGFWTEEGDNGLFGRGVNIYGGSGGNTIDIRSVHTSGALSTPFGKTITTVFAGEANDTLTASVADDVGRLLVVRGQAGDDGINASASSLPLIIFGNEHQDTIQGGSSGDHIFGDDARIYYLLPDMEGGFDIVLGGAPVEDVSSLRTKDDDVFLTADLIHTSAGMSDRNDLLKGHAGDDLILAGGNGCSAGCPVGVGPGIDMNAEILIGGDGHDVLFGDYARITLVGGTKRIFESIDRTLGGTDYFFGSGDDDVIVGGAFGDVIDGNAAADMIFGDAVKLLQRDVDSQGQGDITNPRFQALAGTLMYDGGGEQPLVDVSVDGVPRNHRHADGSVPAWAGIEILDLYHTVAIESASDNSFGNDYIAGGPDDDMIFGQLGDDTVQGDGSIHVDVGTLTDPLPSVEDFNHVDAGSHVSIPGNDGDDYVEGGGGSDLVFGNLGQDDLIGGSSDLFTLGGAGMRPDGADHIFGGAGTRIDRNHDVADGDSFFDQRHARDADTILGDNGSIIRLVGVEGQDGDGFLTFNYDRNVVASPGDPVPGTVSVSSASGYDPANRPLIPRGVILLDYTPGGDAADVGAGDLVRGESGDDTIHGQVGDDVLFGDSEDDDLYGEAGNDWISGGTGEDGILGDDGLILTSRNVESANSNDGALSEPLYGIAKLDDTTVEISTPGNIQQAVIDVENELKKSVDLIQFEAGGNDILFGGLGSDSIHAGAGDDAASGAEALPEYYAVEVVTVGEQTFHFNELLQKTQTAPGNGSPQPPPFWFDFAPYNPGDILRFGAFQANEFALYDEFDPRRKIMLDEGGNLAKDRSAGAIFNFVLNFTTGEGVADTRFSDTTAPPKPNDGDDRIFGDLDNDWLVGGTGRDRMYGGRGIDLLNADDDHDSTLDPDAEASLANDTPDEFQTYADTFYGGAGLDVLILNTGADRAIDWVGEFNSYIAPFAAFGAFHISRTLQPQLPEFLYALSESDGADQTVPDRARFEEHKALDVRVSDPDPARNGEPYGEIGLVLQEDFDWSEQTGAPDDPQPGNLGGGSREVMTQEQFDSASEPSAFAADAGTWTISGGGLSAAPAVSPGDAVSLYHLDQIQPDYFEILVTVDADRARDETLSNGFILFDYQDETDFKFAGVDVKTNKLQIGQRTQDGWIVLTQSNRQMRPNRDVELLVALHGTVATLIVDGAQSLDHSFSDPLNDGLIGLGTNNSVTRFDDFQVQKLPPQWTFSLSNDFSDDAADLLFPRAGQWHVADGQYLGTPAVGGDRAVSTYPLGVAPSSILELYADVRTLAVAGLVFDYYSLDEFKFAGVDAVDSRLVIGHHTAGRGWSIDAAADLRGSISQLTLGVSLRGNVAGVTVDGKVVLGHVYNSLLNDGEVGLITHGGSGTFDDFLVRGDDPALEGVSFAASGVPAGETLLSYDPLASATEEAVTWWDGAPAADGHARFLDAHVARQQFSRARLNGRLALRSATTDAAFEDWGPRMDYPQRGGLQAAPLWKHEPPDGSVDRDISEGPLDELIDTIRGASRRGIASAERERLFASLGHEPLGAVQAIGLPFAE